MIEKIKLYTNDLPDDLVIKGDIAVDTEAMGLSYKRDRLCLIQIADESGQVYVVQIERGHNKSPNLAKVLEDPSRQKIFHFARFDVAILRQYLSINVNNIFCTKIASKLVRTYTDSHGLKELCRELLSVQLSKQQQSSDWGSAVLSSDQQKYCANDVIYLHQLREKLKSMLIREERLLIAQACFDFMPQRVWLDLAGWETVDIFAHS